MISEKSRGQITYCTNDAVNYLATLLTAGTFMARLTEILGISDAATGILSAFVSLGAVFSLISVFIKPQKSLIVFFRAASTFFFSLSLAFPMFNIKGFYGTLGFGICLLLGYFTSSISNPLSVGWLMLFVPDNIRGKFTACKESVSLISGIVFTLILSKTVDVFYSTGKVQIGFLICAAVLILCGIYTVYTYIRTPFKEIQTQNENRVLPFSYFKNRKVLIITAVISLWNIAQYSSYSFYGSFQNKELGFSLLFSTVLTAIGYVFRLIIIVPLGKFADRHSFAKLLLYCLIPGLAAGTVMCFATNTNGKICLTLFNLLSAVTLTAVSTCMTNLAYDYLPENQAGNAFGVVVGTSGIIGFLASLVGGKIVNAVQKNGNMLFGKPVYAQQILSAFSGIFIIATMLYILFRLLPLERVKK